MRLFPIAVAALALLASPALARPAVITNPSWISKPSGEELEHLYPPRARDAALDGEAVIECSVELDETLTHCEIISETPPGYGFGQSTMAAASLFRLHPKTVNGKPVAGARVRVPLHWSVQEMSYPVLEAVETDRAAACFAIYFVGIETDLVDPTDNPVMQMFQWAGFAVAKTTETTSDVSGIDARMRAGILPARRRASASPENFKREIEACDAEMRTLYRTFGNGGADAPGSPH